MGEPAKHPRACSLNQLKETMVQTLPRPTRPRPPKEKKSGDCLTFPTSALAGTAGKPPLMTPGLIAMLGSAMAGINMDPYNEVFPGIVLGDQSLAFELDKLKQLGVTHILNTAMGKKFNQINTSEESYAELGVTFMGISAMDVARFDISRYFSPTADFINGALASGGKVFVHCQMGLSRSATLVLSYLMLKQNLDVKKAMQTVRRERGVMPNDGFLKQLVRLNEELYCTEKETVSQDETNISEPKQGKP